MTPYYQSDRITIYHGDCRDVVPTLAPVHAILTDPPYSVPVKYQDTNGVHPRSWGDLVVMEPFFAEVFRCFQRVAEGDAQVYICCDATTYPVFFRVAYPLWPASQALVWYKPTGRRGGGWKHAYELVLHCRTATTTYAEGFRQDVIGIMPVRTIQRQHPAEKPGDLWTFVSEAFPSHYNTVLDPFMGGGDALLPRLLRLEREREG
jgi:hypothetical protein